MIWPEPVSPLSTLDLLRQPEIRNPWMAVPIEQDVARFEVTMDHAAAVSVLNRLSHLTISAPPPAAAADPRLDCAQGSALDKAHGEIMLAVVLANFKDPHDPRMVEVGGGFSLEVKSLDFDCRRRAARPGSSSRRQPD